MSVSVLSVVVDIAVLVAAAGASNVGVTVEGLAGM